MENDDDINISWTVSLLRQGLCFNSLCTEFWKAC